MNTPYAKKYLKMVIDLDRTANTIKLLEQNIGVNLGDLIVGNVS